MGADDTLRSSQELLAKLFRNSPAAVGLVRFADGLILDVNEAYERLFGWSRREVVGRSTEELGIWADPQARERFRALIEAQGRVVDFESRARRKSGDLFDSLLSSETVEHGGERLALVIVTDISPLKRSERALRASEEKFVKMFQVSPEWSALSTRQEGKFLEVNAGVERISGYGRAELIGRSALELGIWIDPGQRAALIHDLEAGRPVRDVEVAFRTKSGERRMMLMSMVMVDLGDEKCILAAGRDVTDLLHNQRALRQSEQRYRTLAATLVEGILILQDGRFAYANPGALELIGHPFEELQGREFAPFIHPEDREQVRERHRRRSAGETLEPRYDIRILPRSGEPRWVQIANEKVQWEGRPAVLTVISDITERKRGEAALRESEQRFKALVELSSDWYWMTDAEHRFTFREGEVLHRMGIPPDEDYGKRRWEMPGFINMDAQAWAAHRAVLERREEFRDLLLERRSPDGRIHCATISGRPLYAADGAFIGYHGTGRDVTRQIDAERRLRRFNLELERKVAARTAELDAANRELEAFAYSVSHDLRAPLRAIEGFARLLEERHGAALADEARGYLRRVREGARRMNRLIDDLLAFSRVGRAQLSVREVDVSALAKMIAAELGAAAPERRVDWRIAEGLRVQADPGLLRVVLANLLGNAWKYTGRAERARIELGRTPEGELFVRDDGVGFDPAHAAGLFEPFRRLHGEEFEGSGVGLATVKRVIERHGGRVRAEGAPGAGAAFYISLPPAG